MTGWMLMPAGRAHGEVLLAQQLDAAGQRSELDAIYRRFLEHNQPFLSLCTDWQVRMVDGAQVPNDHGDAEYDTWTSSIIRTCQSVHRLRNGRLCSRKRR